MNTVQTDCPKCFRFGHGDGPCPPPPVTAVLPFTGKVVPEAAAALIVKPKGSMSTHDGEAFNAEVWQGKRCIGTIENSGNGGGTDFFAGSREAREMFAALVDEYAAIDEDHRWVAHESLCNDLYEEAMLPREMNRKRNPTFRVIGTEDTYTAKGGSLSDAQWAKVVADFGPVERWVKGTGWVAVSA